MLRSYHFQQIGPECELKASIQQVDTKLTASVLMGSVLIATLCLRLWDAFNSFSTVGSYTPHSHGEIFTAVLNGVKWTS